MNVLAPGKVFVDAQHVYTVIAVIGELTVCYVTALNGGGCYASRTHKFRGKSFFVSNVWRLIL